MKDVRMDSKCPARESNPVPAQYVPRALLLHQAAWWLVTAELIFSL
jgi:hypothetical protein